MTAGRSNLKFHRLTRGEVWDAGKYKEKDGDIIEKFSDGRSRVRFKTVPAADTPVCMKELAELYDDAIKERKTLPLVLQAIDRALGPFRIAELLNECPNVSVDMIRCVS